MPPKGGRSSKVSKKSEDDVDLEQGDQESDSVGANDREEANRETTVARRSTKKAERQQGRRLEEDKKKDVEKPSADRSKPDGRGHASWWSCRGCCRLFGHFCRRRCGMCCNSIRKGISDELKGLGIHKTATYKRIARFLNGSASGQPKSDMWQWMTAQVEQMVGTEKQVKKKKKKAIHTWHGNRIIDQPESSDGFSLASFVIHNDGNIQDFFELDETEQGGQEIAAGGCSHIYKAAERQTHIMRAIKRITKKDVGDEEFLKNEVAIMKRLDHPNIPKLFEIFESDKYVYLVMELCEGGDLMDKILASTAMTEPVAGVVMKGILMALFYLHSNEIVHRDIKPENVMLRSADAEISISQIRIVDFGFAKVHELDDEELMDTKVGSPYYVAPEILNGEGYDMRADIWSAGVIAYLVLCGYPPFSGATDAETLELVKKGEFIFPKDQWKHVTKEAKHLVAHMLRKNPQKRIGLMRALDHPWIRTKGLTKWEQMREETVDRLITYHKHHALRKAAMLAIAYQMEPQDITKLRDLYHSLDANGDGLLQRSEFMKGVAACGVDEHFIQEMIRSVDADSSGLIDYTEFIAATLEKDTYIKNHAVCLRAFRSFDHDDSGQLSLEEIAQILDMGSSEHEEEVAYFFNQVDDDKDGFMDYREFHCMLQVEIDGLRANRDDKNEFVVDEEDGDHVEGEESEEESFFDQEADFEFDTHVDGHAEMLAKDDTMATDKKTLATRKRWSAREKERRRGVHEQEADFTTGKHADHHHQHDLNLAEAEVIARRLEEEEEQKNNDA